MLLRELGGAEALDRLSAMRRSAEQYVAAQSKADAELWASLDRSLTEARQGFRIVAGMDVAVFVAGYALLGIGIYLVRKRSPGVPSYAAGRMPCSMSAGVGSKDGAGCPQSAASQAAVT